MPSPSVSIAPKSTRALMPRELSAKVFVSTTPVPSRTTRYNVDPSSALPASANGAEASASTLSE